MGLFGKIGGAIKGAVGAGGGNKGGGGGMKQVMQQKGIGPSAPPVSPMPDVPVGNPNQDQVLGPSPMTGGQTGPDLMTGPQQFNDGPQGPPNMGGWAGGLMNRVSQMQRPMGQMDQMGQGGLSVPQGQFEQPQMGQGNFGKALQGAGQMYGQMMPPQAQQMGRGQMKQQQMGLGPSPQMAQRMPQMGRGFGQGTGGRMQQMRPQMGQRPAGMM